MPLALAGDLGCEVFVDIDSTLSAGEAAPDRACSEGALDCALAVEGLELGGRIDCFLLARAEAGRGSPAIARAMCFGVYNSGDVQSELICILSASKQRKQC